VASSPWSAAVGGNGPPVAASAGRRASGTSPLAADGRALAYSSQSVVCAARSASSAKVRPGRRLDLTHFTSDSTPPFWLPAPGSQAWGWQPHSPASCRSPGVRTASPLASRPLVTVFILSNTSTHGTRPRAARQSTSPRKRVSWRLSAVKRTQVQRLYFSRQARKERVAGACWVKGKCRTSPQSTWRYSAGSPAKRIGTSDAACCCCCSSRTRRTYPRKTRCPPRYGRSGSARANASIRSAVNPSPSHPAICARYGSTFERRCRFAGARSTGSCNTRLIVVGLRPNSAAIWRMLLPRFARRWIVLRSSCRNILPPSHSTGFLLRQRQRVTLLSRHSAYGCPFLDRRLQMAGNAFPASRGKCVVGQARRRGRQNPVTSTATG
jgi:hypothetical protein